MKIYVANDNRGMGRKAAKIVSAQAILNPASVLGLEPARPQSCRYFMQKNLFDHINIDPAATNVLNGLAGDLGALSQL